MYMDNCHRADWKRSRIAVVASLCLLALSSLVSSAAEITTMTGATHQGELLGLSNQEIRYKSEGKSLTLKTADVLSVDLSVATPTVSKNASIRIQLLDGTLLLATSFLGKGNLALVQLTHGVTVTVPWGALQHVLFQANNPDQVTEFDTLLTQKPRTDVLRLLSRDGQSINTFQGVLGDPDVLGKVLPFQPTDGRLANIAWDRLRGLYFNRSVPTGPAPVCKVMDTVGNVYSASVLRSERLSVPLAGEGIIVRIATPTGLEVHLPMSCILRFDFSLGKVAYLSDMEPLRMEKASMLEENHPGYRRNKNLLGRPISLGGKTYSRGLALRSRVVLEYEVSGYNFFQTLVGIDDDVSGTGHAIVKFEGDGRELFSTPVTRRDVKPKEVELRITGIKRLRVIIDFGEDYDLGDHVDLANARIIK